MSVITSKDNSIIKELASLKEKKYRDEFGEYIVEGPNLVNEVIAFGGRPRFIFTKAALSDEIKTIISKCDNSTAIYEISDELFLKLVDSKTPQGIACVVKKNIYSPKEFFKLVGNKNILVLDRLQDPGNVGTLLRSCEAMDFGGIIFMKGTADPYQPKVVRAAAGSLQRIPILSLSTNDELVKLLRANNKRIYSASMEGSIPIHEADLKENIAIIIGNEGNGVCEELKQASDKISIPMGGNLESLNAAVAGTIIMYESKRQKI